jgi:hypothetical protein
MIYPAHPIVNLLKTQEVKTLFIEPFNGKMRDELLNRELFPTLEKAKVLINQWWREYNQIRPHSDKNYRLTAPETILANITR